MSTDCTVLPEDIFYGVSQQLQHIDLHKVKNRNPL